MFIIALEIYVAHTKLIKKNVQAWRVAMRYLRIYYVSETFSFPGHSKEDIC